MPETRSASEVSARPQEWEAQGGRDHPPPPAAGCAPGPSRHAPRGLPQCEVGVTQRGDGAPAGVQGWKAHSHWPSCPEQGGLRWETARFDDMAWKFLPILKG